MPKLSGAYAHQRLRSPKGLHHLRTVTAGKHRVVVGCPTATHTGRCRLTTVAQAILHPKGERRVRTNPTLAIFGNPRRSRKARKAAKVESPKHARHRDPDTGLLGGSFFESGFQRMKPGRKAAAHGRHTRTNPLGTRLQHLMSNRVYVVEYQHKEDGKNYKHEFGYGVRMYALSNGDILLTHSTKKLWGNFR